MKLCKSQVVEKLDLMQCAADSFEQEKESGKKEMHDILAFAIVSIGYGVNLDDPDLDREFIARRLRVEKPAKSVDLNKSNLDVIEEETSSISTEMSDSSSQNLQQILINVLKHKIKLTFASKSFL